MSSNALLWPSQGTKPEERLDKYKWLKLPSQGVGGLAEHFPVGPIKVNYPPIGIQEINLISFANKDKVVTDEDQSPVGTAISKDGFTMFMLGGITKTIFQYALAIPNDVTTASFTGKTLLITEDAIPVGLIISDDGHRLFTIGKSNNKILQYNLPIENDLVGAAFSTATLSIFNEDQSAFSLAGSSDGLRLFMVGEQKKKISQYNVSKLADLIAALFSGKTVDTGPEDPLSRGSTISKDGLTLFMSGTGFDKIYQYNLSIANDLTTAEFSGNEIDVFAILGETAPEGLTISTDGFRLFMIGNVGKKIYQFNLSKANDLSTAVFDSELLVSGQDSNPRGVTISKDGFRVFMTGLTNDRIYQYNLSTANEITSGLFNNFLSISAQDDGPEGLTITSDGLRLFMAGFFSKKIFQYNLTTANDLTTAVYSGTSNDLDVSGQDDTPFGLTISTDGTTLFMQGGTTDKVYQYDVSQFTDLATGVFSGKDLDISAQTNFPLGLAITSDGLTIFMSEDVDDIIFQYNLATPNEIATAIFSGIELDVSAQDTIPSDLDVSNDGLTMLMAGTSNEKIFQFNIEKIPNTFQFYKFYQIKRDQVVGTQTNIPVVIIDTLGFGVIQQISGNDIRVFDSLGNPLPYQVQSVTMTTGAIVVWVNMTTLKDGDFIQLTFGNPTIINGENANALWADYTTVHHLNEETFSSNSIKDSTVNAINATPVNMDGTNSVAGKIGNAISFNGTDETINLAVSSLLNNIQNGVILSAWVKLESTTTTRRIFSNRTSWGFAERLNLFSFTTFDIKDYDTSIVTAFGTFHHTALHFDTNNDVTFYFDGVNMGKITGTTPANIGTGSFSIGSDGASAEFWDGTLEEVRVKTTIPANLDDLIATEFNNQNDNDAFWFKTPLLANGEDHLLVDDMGRNIVAVSET